MKFTKTYASILFAVLFTTSAFSQDRLTHEKRIFKDSTDKVFVNRDIPVYLSISTKPDGSDATVLKGQNLSYSYPMYFDSEGYNSIKSPWAVDPETKKTVLPKQDVVFKVYADGTAPNVNLILIGDQKTKLDGVTVSNGNEISFEAKDNLSGVEDIFYSIDETEYKRYNQTIKLPENKIYTISYYTVDNVGNASDPKSMKFRPDLAAPISSVAIEGDQSEQSVSERTTIVLSAKDDISGVSKTFYSIDEGRTITYTQPIKLTGLSEGEHSITYFSSDKVGNVEAKKTMTFFLDKSAPRVISEVIGNTFIANGKEYYSGKTKLKLVAMDNKSGVKEILYSINGGEFTTYENPFYLTEPGDLRVDVLAIDKVNNRQKFEEISDTDKNRSYVDLSGPELSYRFSGPSFVIRDTIYLNQESKIILTGKDAESGFKEIDYQLNGNTLKKYTEPFSIEEEGFYNITYNGYDNLQNSNMGNVLVQIDNTGPEVFNRFSITSNKVKSIEGERLTVYPPHVVLFLSSTDKYSGLDKITYQINGSNELAYSSLIENFKRETVYTIIVNVTDKLGNKNSEEIKFYIE